MPNPQPPLEHGKYFHIYNRGINRCNLFAENKNYEYFLNLYDKYISEIAQTYAWVLMPNHFHFLVQIKEEEKIGFNLKKQVVKAESANRIEGQSLISSSDFDNTLDFTSQKYKPENQFSNLFNAYAQAFNRKYKRTGSLFEHTFHRKEVDNIGYFKQVILYIHQNPVHHGFCSHPIEYPWSSYITCVSDKKTKLQRDAVVGWFKSVEEFKLTHSLLLDEMKIEEWLGI